MTADAPLVLRYTHEKPTEDGRYVVLQRGTIGPIIAHWSDRDGWRTGARRLEVVAWKGPIVVDRAGAL